MKRLNSWLRWSDRHSEVLALCRPLAGLLLLAATLGLSGFTAAPISAPAQITTGVVVTPGVNRQAEIKSHLTVWYDIDCYDTHHNLAWHRRTHNLLTTAGANVYMNSAIAGGIPVAAESEGNTGGSATVTTLTLLQNQAATGEGSLIVPGSLTSLVEGAYSGTFKDLVGAGAVTCTGTCSNFTSGTINYLTGVVTVNCTSACPGSGVAGTASYAYVPVKWYVGLLYEAASSTNTTTQTNTAFAITDTLASNSWASAAGGAIALETATQVTNSTRPLFVGSAVSAGSSTNSGSVAVYTGNATVNLVGAYLTNSNILGGTTYGQLLGEASFTAAPIASGYTINITATDSITAG